VSQAATVVRRPARRIEWTWLGVAPFLVFAFAFLGLPALLLIWGAFTDIDGHVTLANFPNVFHDKNLDAYRTSVAISAVTAVMGGVFGFFLAFAALSERAPGWIRPILVTFSGVASNFAGVPLAYSFIFTLGVTGSLTVFLSQYLHVNLYDLGFSIYSFWGLALVYLYFQLPLMVLLMVPTLQALRREWREASESLGASSRQFWRWVGLPILTPPLLGSVLLLFGNAFGAYATAYSLSQGEINLVPIRIGYIVAGNVSFDPNGGDALALGMIVIMTVCIVGFSILQRRTSRWIRQ
jgi:putative spermidine/putrescine transport system permease protein